RRGDGLRARGAAVARVPRARHDALGCGQGSRQRAPQVGGRAERRHLPGARAGREHRPVTQPEEVSPAELAELIERDPMLQLVDVRETWEAELAALPGAMLLPLGRLPELT